MSAKAWEPQIQVAHRKLKKVCRPNTLMPTGRLTEEPHLHIPDTQDKRAWLSVQLSTGTPRLVSSAPPGECQKLAGACWMREQHCAFGSV